MCGILLELSSQAKSQGAWSVCVYWGKTKTNGKNIPLKQTHRDCNAQENTGKVVKIPKKMQNFSEQILFLKIIFKILELKWSKLRTQCMGLGANR